MNEKNERISKSIQDNPWICVIWIIAIIINTMLIYCLNTKSKCFCPPISSNLDAFADKDKWLLIFTIVASMLALSIGLISALRLPRQISFRLQLIVALLVTLFITMYSREKLVMETTLENFTDNRNAVEVLGDTIKARVGSVGSLVTIEADTLRDSIRIARDSIISEVDSSRRFVVARVGSVGSLVTIEADALRDSIRIARDSIIASVDSSRRLVVTRVGSVGSLVTFEADTLRDSIRIAGELILNRLSTLDKIMSRLERLERLAVRDSIQNDRATE